MHTTYTDRIHLSRVKTPSDFLPNAAAAVGKEVNIKASGGAAVEGRLRDGDGRRGPLGYFPRPLREDGGGGDSLRQREEEGTQYCDRGSVGRVTHARLV